MYNLNGEITLNSNRNFGTELTIRLPWVLSENACQEEINNDKYVPHAGADLGGDRPSILLVEDNADMSKYLTDKLELKYRVIHASNGKIVL